ncbi:hypothetical protein PBCVCan184_356L [Paramecium bursaria Chlorella virus Can18-4]|nr:hypothetical protein PBCVCan184_356L [Paramecium bursaria Chlorella virus Can18-4]
MLVLNRDSAEWKHPNYNVKGHQFVYFIRNHDSDSAKVGLHNRDIASLRARYKTYYSSFDAYIVRVTDSKHVEKRLFEAFGKHGMHLTHELVRNNTATRDMFKYVASKYDLDHHGKQTHKSAQLIKNYHETKKPAPQAYKPNKMIKPVYKTKPANKPKSDYGYKPKSDYGYKPKPAGENKPMYRNTRETEFLYGKPSDHVSTPCCCVM